MQATKIVDYSLLVTDRNFCLFCRFLRCRFVLFVEQKPRCKKSLYDELQRTRILIMVAEITDCWPVRWTQTTLESV